MLVNIPYMEHMGMFMGVLKTPIMKKMGKLNMMSKMHLSESIYTHFPNNRLWCD
jgi:hypothetical protein